MTGEASALAEKLLAKYPLCNVCLGRQFQGELKHLGNREKGSVLRGGAAEPESCYICGFIMSSVDAYAERVMEALKGYVFQRFLIGAHILADISEREDRVRAEFKLKGGEVFKADFTRQLGLAVSSGMGAAVNYSEPEVTAIVDPVTGKVEVKSRSIHLFGRYVKIVRGLPQKRPKCRECWGRGCGSCDFTGYLPRDSVEKRLAEPLLQIFKGSRVKFTWIGSEDDHSLALGRGRPFYAEIFEPRVRKPRGLASALRRVDGGVSVKEVRILKGVGGVKRTFSISVGTKITLDRPLSRDEAKSLEEAFRSVEVRFLPPNKVKGFMKKIYSLDVKRRRGRHVELQIECEGGVNVRSLLTGEGAEVTPSVAETIGRKVTLDEEAPFDILDVTFDPGAV